jgi:hypothetical protein
VCLACQLTHVFYLGSFCAGRNHDYLGNVQAQLDFSNIDSRWIMPQNYFTKSWTVGTKHTMQLVRKALTAFFSQNTI